MSAALDIAETTAFALPPDPVAQARAIAPPARRIPQNRGARQLTPRWSKRCMNPASTAS